jgi:hypothetical protein
MRSKPTIRAKHHWPFMKTVFLAHAQGKRDWRFCQPAGSGKSTPTGGGRSMRIRNRCGR